jgi:hypothetical protein
VLKDDPDAVNTLTATGGGRGLGANDPDAIVNARPQLMEWAIGKGYDLYRPGTGKLMLPGESINPDPDQWVGFGDRTVDEMAHAWMNVTYFNDAEYQALMAERKAKLAKTTDENDRQR